MPQDWHLLRTDQTATMAAGKFVGLIRRTLGQGQQATPDPPVAGAPSRMRSPSVSSKRIVSRTGSTFFGRATGSSAATLHVVRRRYHASGRLSTAACYACTASNPGPSDPAYRPRCPDLEARRRRAATFPCRQLMILESPRCRNSAQRSGVPSRIAERVPKANTLIAAAVERPIPGSSAIARVARGNSPPSSAATIRAHLCRFRPRA